MLLIADVEFLCCNILYRWERRLTGIMAILDSVNDDDGVCTLGVCIVRLARTGPAAWAARPPAPARWEPKRGTYNL